MLKDLLKNIDINITRSQETLLFYIFIWIFIIIVLVSMYFIIVKIECFADPCTQCESAGYICSNPYQSNNDYGFKLMPSINDTVELHRS